MRSIYFKVTNTVLLYLFIAVSIPQAAEHKKELIPGISGYNIGFEELHGQGLLGDKTGVVIFEANPIEVSLTPPAFKNKEMTLIDLSRDGCSEEFKDRSSLRYSSDLKKKMRMNFWSSTDHAQQIASILIGSPPWASLNKDKFQEIN